MKLLAIFPLLTVLFLSNSYASFIETFDGVSSVEHTNFPNLLLSGGGIFELDILSTSLGAPTNPGLPISSGGDKELRYYEGESIAPTHSYATTPIHEKYTTITIAGYVGAGFVQTSGGCGGGIMARVTASASSRSGYLAYIFFNESTATFSLNRVDNNIVNTITTHTQTISIEPNNSNLYVELKLIDSSLKASLWKVTANQEKTLISTLVATDNKYSLGGAGLYSFCRGNKSVFFDNISVITLPPPINSALFLLLKDQK